MGVREYTKVAGRKVCEHPAVDLIDRKLLAQDDESRGPALFAPSIVVHKYASGEAVVEFGENSQFNGWELTEHWRKHLTAPESSNAAEPYVRAQTPGLAEIRNPEVMPAGPVSPHRSRGAGPIRPADE
jgi:hypothetical protein